MRRKVRVTLLRLWPPGAKRVTVESFTVARYFDLLGEAGGKLVRLRRELKRPVTETDLYSSLTHEEFDRFAAYLCPAADPAVFPRYRSARNRGRLVDAMFLVNDWPGLVGCLNFSGEKRKSGSLEGDVVRICERFHVMPWEVMSRYMDEFLVLCKGLRDNLEADEPPEPEVATISALKNSPGIEVVH